MARFCCSPLLNCRLPPAFTSLFETVPDPRRVQANVAHPLRTVIAVGFVEVLCGAEGWDRIVVFAEGKQAWMSSWLDLRNGISSADMLRRVFQRLDPRAFGEGMRGGMLSIVGVLKGNHGALHDAVARCFAVIEAAGNLAFVHRAVLSRLKRGAKVEHGVKLKSSRASCDNDHIEHLLWAYTS